MRWWYIWLSAVLATTSAARRGELTIEEHPLQEQEEIVIPPEQPRPPSDDNIEPTTGPTTEDASTAVTSMTEVTTETTMTTSINYEISTAESPASTQEADGKEVTTPGVETTLVTENVNLNLPELVVKTTSGPIQGFMWQGKEDIVSYMDVPYGKIDDPFQAATTSSESDTLHTVLEHNKRCPQLDGDNFVGNIDCLTLSIFKPVKATDASVLFHIHAENFNTGSGDPSIYGPEYLVSKGIILVLPNYRLGPLGFLCMQNKTAPGNMALKDLSLALNWVSENIEAFGGDSKNITVSGDGRSGALAGLLALSPMSRDYVSKVIAESGSFLSYWALDRDPTSTAALLFYNMATQTREAKPNTALDDYDVEDIVKAGKDIKFRPCLEIDGENAFITTTPYATTSNKELKEKSFLIGSAKFAGVHEALLQTEDSIKRLNEDYSLLLPDDLRFESDSARSRTGERVKEQYFGKEVISLNDVENLSLCFTDIGYLGPGIRSARLLVEAGATVYFYEFAYVGELNRVLVSVERPVEGAVRGDIVGYLFTQDGVMPGEVQTEDGKMVETLTEMWTNFLKDGEPSTDSIEWKKLENQDHSKEEWLLIDSEPSMKQGVHECRLALWTEIYDNHFIEGSDGHQLSPSVYTILIFQWIFWIGVYTNASHIF